MAGQALAPIWSRMNASRSRIAPAAALARARNRRSATKSQVAGAAATAPGARVCWSVLIASSLDVGSRLPHRARHALGERDVSHLRAHLLSFGEAVVDELAKR